MKAGRELDALIAEKIFGISPEEYYVCPTCEYDGLWGGKGPPKYSTDIATAWQVVEKVLNMGGQVDFKMKFISAYGDWSAQFDFMKNLESCYSSALEKSAPLAICLAALKAVGVDP